MGKKINNIINVLLSALIPLGIILFIFYCARVFKGEFTVLTSDLNAQYSSYFTYFRNAVANGDSITYTFSKLIGGDTFSLLGYYMFSPLNLIVFLYPAAKVADAVFLIIVIKVSLAGLTSYLYFARKNNSDRSSLIFSTSYAVMGYVAAFFMHVMWLDAVYLLPLVIMGLERMYDSKKYVVYTLFMSLSLIICYYTGYMIAGFTFLYTLYYMFYVKRSKSDIVRIIVSYLVTSAIAVGISMVTLLPTLLSQLGGHGGGQVANYGVMHNFVNVLSKLFTGVYNMEDFSSGAPQIYCGIVVLVLVILYFLVPGGDYSDDSVKKAIRREKIATGILIIAFVASFMIGLLDMVWHAFASPNSFNHRYSFIFVFLLVMIAERMFGRAAGNIKLIHYIVSIILFAIAGAAVIVMKSDMVNIVYVIIDIIIGIFVLSGIFLFYGKEKLKKIKPVFTVILIIITIIQMSLNGSEYMKIYSFDDYSFEGYYNNVKPVVDKVLSQDDSMYRIEKTFYNSTNDAMMLSYNGLSHFSSSEKNDIKNFAGNLGYTKNYDFWVYYDKGATPAADSFLGVKYILSVDELESLEKTDTVNNINIYKNNNALAFGNMCNNSVLSVAMRDKEPFEFQNDIYRVMSGDGEDVFDKYDYTIDGENVQSALSEEVPGETTYLKQNGDFEASVIITLTAKDDNEIYMYLPSASKPVVNVSVNGEDKGEYLSTYHSGILKIGSFEAGTKVEINLALQSGFVSFKEPQIYSYNSSVLENKCNVISENAWNVSRHGNSDIEADVEAKDGLDTLVMTIPYDKSWEICIDGEKVNQSKVFGMLTSVKVPEGKHHISLHYKVSGLFQGAVVTVVSLLLGIVLLIIVYISRRKHPIQ